MGPFNPQQHQFRSRTYGCKTPNNYNACMYCVIDADNFILSALSSSHLHPASIHHQVVVRWNEMWEISDYCGCITKQAGWSDAAANNQ